MWKQQRAQRQEENAKYALNGEVDGVCDDLELEML